jgi:cold shock CspA family protein
VIPGRAPRRGVVAEFDPDAGYGTLADDGGARWWFHCTAIADGSRRIAAGTPVRFGLVPGRQGRYEGVDVSPA